jgi:putative ABC transport system substrate-binding protein
MTQNVLRLALSAMLVALSVPATAQPPPNIPRIGYLATHPDDMKWQPFFLHGLRALGYTEGKNIVIEQRHAVEGQHARIRELAAELVRLQVDVIVVSAGARDKQVAKEAITTIPFVFIESPDPVGLGLVESLARPGGNATGLSNFGTHLVAKRLELLKEVVPAAARIAFLWMSGSPTTPLNLQALQAAAPGLGVTLLACEPTFKGSESPFRFFVLRALHTTRSRGPAHHRATGDRIGHHTSARPADHLLLLGS